MMTDGLRWLARILLWGMLILSTLGVVGELFASPPPPPPPGMTAEQVLRLQTVRSFASSFSQAWLIWDGKETTEQRQQRLRPFVSPALLEDISQIQLDQAQRQVVADVQPMDIQQQDDQHVRVRVWAQLLTPVSRVIALSVPVTWDAGDRLVIDGMPVLQPIIPPGAGSPRLREPAADKGVKEAMRPTLEAFLTAYFRGKEASELAPFTSVSTITPLGGWLEMKDIMAIDVYGAGPYQVLVRVSVKDKATGATFPQVYALQVIADRGKYFIAGLR